MYIIYNVIVTLRSNIIVSFFCKGDLVKKLKDQNGDKLELQQAVRELKHRKKLLEGKVGET